MLETNKIITITQSKKHSERRLLTLFWLACNLSTLIMPALPFSLMETPHPQNVCTMFSCFLSMLFSNYFWELEIALDMKTSNPLNFRLGTSRNWRSVMFRKCKISNIKQLQKKEASWTIVLKTWGDFQNQ